MTTSTNETLASIAKRVWEKCPDCRPPQVTTITLARGEAFQVAWDCIDRGHAALWYTSHTRHIPAIELLIIGACVKHLRSFRVVDPSLGRNGWYVDDDTRPPRWCVNGPTLAVALLLACEALAEKENPNG